MRLFRQGMSTVARVTSTEDGHFAIEHLPEGRLLMQVDKEGFRGCVSNVEIGNNENRGLNATLEVAGVNETIVIVAAGVPQKLEEISKAVHRAGVITWNVTGLAIRRNRNSFSLAA